MDIEKLLNSRDIPPREYCIVPDLYQPLIIGKASDLFDRFQQLQSLFPRAVEVFLSILNKNIGKHPLLIENVR